VDASAPGDGGQIEYGCMYGGGTGVARNFETAFEWFAKAAAQTQPQFKGARDTDTEMNAIRNLHGKLNILVLTRGKVDCHDVRTMSHTLALY